MPISAICWRPGSTSAFSRRARLTWDSPASLLEKIIAYEAVHEIRSWQDLHQRLDGDRRCYAFFHPSCRRSR